MDYGEAVCDKEAARMAAVDAGFSPWSRTRSVSQSLSVCRPSVSSAPFLYFCGGAGVRLSDVT